MLGPALAGLIVAAVGPGWCFFINGLSFLVVIGALLAMNVPPLSSGRVQASMWSNVVEGIRYIRSEPTIVMLLSIAAVPSVFAMFYQAMMPAFAESVLQVGAQGLGLLMSAAGMGAVVGALGVASLGASFPRGRLMVAAVLSLGSFLMVFGSSRVFALSLVALVVVGASGMTYNAINQTFLQTLAKDQMRGRVMSILTLTTFGLQPLGTLVTGTLGDLVGPPTVMVGGGLVCAAFALLLLARGTRVRQLA
jgi:MFS family permease